jgi:hypothetical protein
MRHLAVLRPVLRLFPALLLAGVAAAQDPAVRRGADPSEDAFRFGSPPALPEGMTEEQMWPAASAEQWREPCLVQWQRSFDDAVAVARARHQPILVAVNMDGEIASEHFAGVRYREPATAEQLARYVCVIASVYRHTPRDHDPAGARVECPRFGTVTCGEHVEAERELYERYFEGVRVSPRHIVLDLEGRKTQDVFYSWDTATVLTGFAKGVEGWPEPRPSPEPTLENLARSADVEDRERLESDFQAGDRSAKRALLVALAAPEAAEHVEVLRAAISGFDPELARLARHALAARAESDGALDLIAEALQVPLESSERELLLGAVERLGESLPRARTLAALHAGLALGARPIALVPADSAAQEYEANAAGLQARAEAAESRPAEPAAQLALAEGLLESALEAEGDYAALYFEDARTAALDAERLGAGGARLDAVVAVAAWGLRDRDTARRRAVAAVEAGLLDPRTATSAGAPGPLGAATQRSLLRIFGAARQAQIRAAFRAGESWEPAWLADVVSTYSALARDPQVAEGTLLESYDFLRWIGATPQARQVLTDALARFHDSPALHERLRELLLWEGGPEALERGYAERLAGIEDRENEAGQQWWFAGYASLVAAEHQRRRGRFEEALAAYGRAAVHYRSHVERNPAALDDGDHYLALADAGRARVEMERGALGPAADALVASLERRPASAASPDGLGITPVATARMLQARLVEGGDTAGAARVQAALDALDPAMLEPPASEQPAAARRQQRPQRDR